MTAVREATMLSKAEFGRRIGVDRGTVNRWETGQTIPRDVDILTRLSTTYQLDYDDVLDAAGLRPPTQPEKQPERDEEADEILASNLPNSVKRELLQVLQEERQRDRDRRMENMRRLIAAQRRRIV